VLTKLRVRFEPINPLAPVTNIRVIDFLESLK